MRTRYTGKPNPILDWFDRSRYGEPLKLLLLLVGLPAFLFIAVRLIVRLLGIPIVWGGTEYPGP